MRILVTGTAGFIGFHVSKALLARGDEVVGIDNINDYYDPNLKRARLEQLRGGRKQAAGDGGQEILRSSESERDRSDSGGFTFIKQDIADREAMARLFAEWKPERVIHLAAQAGVRYSLTNPHAYIDSNLVGFTNILEGCRHNGVEHLTYASSSSVYGANTKMPFSVHDNVDHPLSLYAASKPTTGAKRYHI